MNPAIERYANIPGFIVLYALFFVAIGFFIYRTYQLYLFLRLGGEENRFDHFAKRSVLFFLWVFGEWCVLRSVSKRDRAGISHFVMFWTFILFFIYYAYFFAWGAWHHTNSINVGVLDYFALCSLGVVLWALVRRYVVRPVRLETNFEPAIILVLIFFLMGTHIAGEALKVNLLRETSGSMIASAFARAFSGLSQSTLSASYYTVWWFHIFILFGFLVYIPYSKHLHIIAALFNVFFRSLRPKGALVPIDIETANRLGVEKIEEFSWKQLLDLYACAECGRCQANCPASLRISKPTLSTEG
jgi:hypothetical protein